MSLSHNRSLSYNSMFCYILATFYHILATFCPLFTSPVSRAHLAPPFPTPRCSVKSEEFPLIQVPTWLKDVLISWIFTRRHRFLARTDFLTCCMSLHRANVRISTINLFVYNQCGTTKRLLEDSNLISFSERRCPDELRGRPEIHM